jgi:hypothetical protein
MSTGHLESGVQKLADSPVFCRSGLELFSSVEGIPFSFHFLNREVKLESAMHWDEVRVSLPWENQISRLDVS